MFAHRSVSVRGFEGEFVALKGLGLIERRLIASVIATAAGRSTPLITLFTRLFGPPGGLHVPIHLCRMTHTVDPCWAVSTGYFYVVGDIGQLP